MNLSSEILDFIKKHQDTDIHILALQGHKYPGIDMEVAIRQIAGRRMAKDKIPSWYANNRIIYPKHLSLEQSSSEKTATYKSSLANGQTMADLTGGMGIDFSFMAKYFNKAIYVEQQAELTDIARHNFDVLGLNNTSVINTKAEEHLHSMPPVDLIYLDPARRDGAGKKTVRIEDCTPNILEMEATLEEKAETVMIKLSPMLDISLALKSLNNVSDVHVVAVNNEVKELLFIKRKNTEGTQIHCVNIKNTGNDVFSFTANEEGKAAVRYVSQLSKYLYEPNAAILKAGAYKSVAEAFSLDKLHVSSHLYTSDELIHFPGRCFLVVNVISLNKRDIKEYLSGMKQANITTRNFPLSVQEIRKKTGLKEGGDVYIFATTLSDEKKVLLVCEKVENTKVNA